MINIKDIEMHEILMKYTTLYRGWEHDCDGWVVQTKDTKQIGIKQTSHGCPFTKYGPEAEEVLLNWKDLYTKYLQDIEQALLLVQNQK